MGDRAAIGGADRCKQLLEHDRRCPSPRTSLRLSPRQGDEGQKCRHQEIAMADIHQLGPGSPLWNIEER